jgi:aryl-alcohol dehydrogenase
MITEALVNSHPGAPFEYGEVKLEDSIRDYEVLVEIKATGVCHTGTIRKSDGDQEMSPSDQVRLDLNFSREKSRPDLFPAILGHEGIAFVSPCRHASK